MNWDTTLCLIWIFWKPLLCQFILAIASSQLLLMIYFMTFHLNMLVAPLTIECNSLSCKWRTPVLPVLLLSYSFSLSRDFDIKYEMLSNSLKIMVHSGQGRLVKFPYLSPRDLPPYSFGNIRYVWPSIAVRNLFVPKLFHHPHYSHLEHCCSFILSFYLCFFGWWLWSWHHELSAKSTVRRHERNEELSHV